MMFYEMTGFDGSLLNIEHHWYSAVVNRLCCKYRTILKSCIHACDVHQKDIIDPTSEKS